MTCAGRDEGYTMLAYPPDRPRIFTTSILIVAQIRSECTRDRATMGMRIVTVL
jgi:hypothetical protein